jgi:poly(beta-D-mannuronate) lyase
MIEFVNARKRALKTSLYLAAWVLIAALQAGPLAAAPLSSPWDAPVAASIASETACPAGIKPTKNLSASRYYEDDSVTVDPSRKAAYRESTSEPRSAAQQVVDLADDFQSDGDLEVAHCAAELILMQAKAGALTGQLKGNQAELFRAWMLNAYATAWLKIRQQSGLNPDEQSVIKAWLVRLAEGTIKFHSKFMPSVKEHNLRYWAALGVMNAGVASDDSKLYDWGLNWAKAGVMSIQEDGTLKQELKRGARATRYHLFALQPLIAMADIGLSNGFDLYSLNDDALRRLVNTTLAALRDPSLMEEKSGARQLKQTSSNTDLEWLRPFANRFPDPTYDYFLSRYPAKPDLYLGGRLAPVASP